VLDGLLCDHVGRLDAVLERLESHVLDLIELDLRAAGKDQIEILASVVRALRVV
jgi:CheY-like chemotaxis protein